MMAAEVLWVVETGPPMKTKQSKKRLKSARNPLAIRAAELERVLELAREKARKAKQEYKRARKAFKAAKKATKLACKEAKSAMKAASGGPRKSKKRAKPAAKIKSEPANIEARRRSKSPGVASEDSMANGPLSRGGKVFQEWMCFGL
jgi:hypothetical protein